uniref:Uncharacterized protein n=1 Tax=Salix viminalis TaxID=40686 RepID=A0A6N2LDY7_SALVM
MSLRVLNPNAEVLNKSAALHMNINAAKGLQDLGAGDIKLTKDGNTLLKKSNSKPDCHYDCKDSCCQDDISGDGTTSTVIFIGELMKQSERNSKMVARTTIRTKLYEALADQLTDIVVNSVLCIRKPEEAIDLFMVEIMHMRHKFDVDTRLEIDDWFCYNFRQCCQEALRWHLHTCIGTLGEYGLSDEDFNYNHEMEDSSEGVEGLVLDHFWHPDMKSGQNFLSLTI